MRPDPKFGYHWLWMVPVTYVLLLVSALLNRLTELYNRAKIRYVTWRHPEIKRLQEQAGIRKE